MFKSFFAFSLLSQACAWLPGEHRQLLSRDGLDLFNRSNLHDAGLIEKRFLPAHYGNDKNVIRGVNLGSLFIIENWMSSTIFSGWGCKTSSEFDCVSSIANQAKANSLFQEHWGSWVTASDFKQMVEYGLNTVRIPLGYWLYEDIVDSSEHFPQGGEAYLDHVVRWAKDAGLFVMLELHGAPGAQVTDAFTGQLNPSPAFYTSYNYDRAYRWLEWITKKIHTDEAYSAVGMLELVNEPQRTWDTTTYPSAVANAASMRETYYPIAISKIRAVESSLSVSSSSALHIQVMDGLWGSGDPNTYLASTTNIAYDDHNYVKYSGVAQSQAAYLAHSCADDRSGNSPVFVGEWSLSVDSAIEHTPDWDPSTHADWYKKWWAAQVMQYEKSANGWVFWTWKTTGLNDPRWDYQKAVALGIIDKNPDVAYEMGVC